MKIGIAISGCDLGESGISRYLIELLKALAAVPGDEEYLLFGSKKALDVFDPRSPRVALEALDDKTAEPIPNLLWNLFSLPAFARRHGLDLLFFPAANRRMPLKPGLPVVATAHDLSSLHMKGKYPLSHELYIKYLIPFQLKRLDSVISISEATKKDLVESAGVNPSNITIIPHGVDLERFAPGTAQAAAPAAAAKYSLHAPYFLYISRIEHPGKNHVRLIRAFAGYKKRTGAPTLLVLAGKDWDRAELVHREAEAMPCSADIRFTGFASNEDVAGLYGGATALFFPSLFEGFGMPLLEAMAAGLPVFCSNCSSLPEVGGDAARYFDPADEASIAEAMVQAGDAALLETMRLAGLSRAGAATWASTASATVAIMRSTARRNTP